MAGRLRSIVLVGLVVALPLCKAVGEALATSAWHISLHTLSRDRLLPGEPPAPCSGDWLAIIGSERFRELACEESALPGDFPVRTAGVRLHLIAEQDRIFAAGLEQRLTESVDLEALEARLESGLPGDRHCVRYAPRIRQCRYGDGLVTISTEPPADGAGAMVALLYVSDADRFAAYVGALQSPAAASPQ